MSTTSTDMSWDTRMSRLAALEEQARAIRMEQDALAEALVARLDAYEQMIEQHGLDIEVTCGFRTHPGAPTFWRFNYLYADNVCFRHHCYSSHVDVYGDEELVVPVMALTHPDEWLVLHALSGGKAV